jgi:mono/diheme cytochrome c family protein
MIVVDLCHGIVQHKAYLTPYLREHIVHRKLESDPQLGRIYRIKHKANPLGSLPQMIGRPAVELVPFLAHDNGWWRDTAQQRIIDSGDLDAVPALNSMAAHSAKPLGQIHALWTLEGLGALNFNAVRSALESQDPYVLEMAVRLAELLSPQDKQSLMPRLSELAARSERVVRRQLAASLGRFPGDDALHLLKQILIKDIDQPFFREAAIHGLGGREQQFKDLLGEDLNDAKFNEYLAECLRIKTTAAAFDPPRDKNHLASFKRGETLFVAHCLACHGADGGGIDQLGPPLVASEWVTGSHKRLAAILLQGMAGPLKVAGKDYNPAAPMPGFKQNTDLTDQHLADIATFARHAWNNRKDAVKPSTFKEVRSELSDRDTLFSAPELEQAYP